VLSAY
jgi:hypothetical protein